MFSTMSSNLDCLAEDKLLDVETNIFVHRFVGILNLGMKKMQLAWGLCNSLLLCGCA